jgi:hypothetical protein
MRTSFLKTKTDPEGRFRYWLISDLIQKDEATI